jgi:uncharacterized membrane protein
MQYADTVTPPRGYEDREDWPDEVNVHRSERTASSAVGAALVVLAGLRRGLVGLGIGLIGGMLMQRGATGHCHLYSALRVSTAHGRRGPSASVPHNQGVKVKRSLAMKAEPAEVYAFWRRLENLPIVMHRIESVTPLSEGRSQWRARGPLRSVVEWTATIINEVEGELIAWRTLEGSQVHHAGSVRFERSLGGNGTLVTVTMEYDPPAGLLGAFAARVIGVDPARQLDEDLHRLKMLLEAGTVPQPGAERRGRLADAPDLESAREILAEDAAEDSAEEGEQDDGQDDAAEDGGRDDRRGVH